MIKLKLRHAYITYVSLYKQTVSNVGDATLPDPAAVPKASTVAKATTPHGTLMSTGVHRLGKTRPLTTRTEGASDWNPRAGLIPNGTGRQQWQRRLCLIIVNRRPSAGVGGSIESTQATGGKMDNVCQGAGRTRSNKRSGLISIQATVIFCSLIVVTTLCGCVCSVL